MLWSNKQFSSSNERRSILIERWTFSWRRSVKTPRFPRKISEFLPLRPKNGMIQVKEKRTKMQIDISSSWEEIFDICKLPRFERIVANKSSNDTDSQRNRTKRKNTAVEKPAITFLVSFAWICDTNARDCRTGISIQQSVRYTYLYLSRAARPWIHARGIYFRIYDREKHLLGNYENTVSARYFDSSTARQFSPVTRVTRVTIKRFRKWNTVEAERYQEKYRISRASAVGGKIRERKKKDPEDSRATVGN